MTATQSPAVDTNPPGNSSLNILSRLSLMMFLQYFIQGSYLPIASVYVQDALGFTARQVGFFGAALALGPILAPFILGQLVDRMFATQRVIAFCHLVGALLMLALFVSEKPAVVIALATLYSVLYVPTMMLTNALAFQHLRNKDLEFPWVRLFGTLGFVVPAYLVEFWWLQGFEGDELHQARGVVFAFAGIMGLVMGVYSLTLPDTPPEPRKGGYAPGVVLRMMMGQRQLLVLVVVGFFIAIAHKFFFVWNSPFLREILDSGGIEGAYEQSISSIGQLCELAVMAVLGFGIKRFGFKWTLLVGASAYAVRCLLFACVFGLDPPFAGKLALACVGQALHGFCFGCFLAAGYMYVDRAVPNHVRGSMQTIFGTFVISLGFFVGGFVSGEIGKAFTQFVDGEPVRDWTAIWLSCAVLAGACAVAFAALFPRQAVEPAAEG